MIFRAVKANVGIANVRARGLRLLHDGGMHRFQILPGCFPLGRRRLIADDDQAEPQFFQAQERLRDLRDQTDLRGMQRTVHRSLFRIDEEFIEHAIPVKADQRFLQSLNPAFWASLKNIFTVSSENSSSGFPCCASLAIRSSVAVMMWQPHCSA